MKASCILSVRTQHFTGTHWDGIVVMVNGKSDVLSIDCVERLAAHEHRPVLYHVIRRVAVLCAMETHHRSGRSCSPEWMLCQATIILRYAHTGPRYNLG